MKKYWILRDEIYGMLHRWPTMIVFLLLGSLIGWISLIIWPSYYQASSKIYVGLNPYRAYSDTNFLSLTKPKYANIDNYMYWQMYQLQAAIYLDGFIQETLEKLKEIDAYWAKYDRLTLLDMLDAEWRTAGEWTLTGKHPEPERAMQIVQTWSRVVEENASEAIQAARNTIIIDQKLWVVSEELQNSQIRQQDLKISKKLITEWSEAAQNLPDSLPLDINERWRILYLTTHLADLTPPWQAILKEQPSENANSSDYIGWIEPITALIDAELSILPELINDLQREHNQLEIQYNHEADMSLSLSPNLEIKEIRDYPARVIQPTSGLVLIGGIVGLLIWILTQLVIITNRVKG